MRNAAWAMIAMFAATPALAAEGGVVATGVQPNTIQVRYGDLDLAAPAGRAELDRRVRSAVNRVCGIAVPSDPVPTVTAACRADAFSGANLQIAGLDPFAATSAGSFGVGGR